MRPTTWIVCLLALTTVAVANRVDAATFYVAKSGSDASPGSEELPFRTIGYGVSRLRAGDTLLIRAGVYDETLRYNVPSGTSWSNKVRIAAYPGETVWMTPTSGGPVMAFGGDRNGGSDGEQKYIEIDGINMDASKLVTNIVNIEGGSSGGHTWNAHHIRIQNAELIGTKLLDGGGLNGAGGILLTAQTTAIVGFNELRNLKIHHMGNSTTFGYPMYVQSSDNVIEGCTLFDAVGAGIQIYNGYVGSAQASRNVIRSTTIRDLTVTVNGDTRIDGIMVGRGVGNKIYNNVVFGVKGPSSTYGIQVYNGSGTEIYNNTVFGNGAYGIYVETGSVDAAVRNNIIYGNGTDFRDNGTRTTTSNNLIGVNPQFTDAAAGNFQLLAGSPALDAGAALPVVVNDLSGTLRPQGSAYDIGAYERQASPSNLNRVGRVRLGSR